MQIQTQCPSCKSHYLYDTPYAVAVDEYGECLHCLTNNKRSFSANIIMQKAALRRELSKPVLDPCDWRQNLKNG